MSDYNHVRYLQAASHYAGEISKRSFNSTVWHTVHMKMELFENALQTGGI